MPRSPRTPHVRFLRTAAANLPLPQWADRGVRPYKTLCEVAVHYAILRLRPARAGFYPAPTARFWKFLNLSNIQIHHIFCIFLDELLARLDRLAHEDGEDLIRSHGVI